CHCTSYRSLDTPLFRSHAAYRTRHSFPTRRSSDLAFEVLAMDAERDVGVHREKAAIGVEREARVAGALGETFHGRVVEAEVQDRSEEHTSELQSLAYLVCRLLLEKQKHHSDPKDSG